MCFSSKGFRRCEVYEQNSEASIWRRFMYSRVSCVCVNVVFVFDVHVNVCLLVCLCSGCYGCMCMRCCAVRSISAPIADVCSRLIVFLCLSFLLSRFSSPYSSVWLLLRPFVSLFLPFALLHSIHRSLFQIVVVGWLLLFTFSCVRFLSSANAHTKRSFSLWMFTYLLLLLFTLHCVYLGKRARARMFKTVYNFCWFVLFTSFTLNVCVSAFFFSPCSPLSSMDCFSSSSFGIGNQCYTYRTPCTDTFKSVSFFFSIQFSIRQRLASTLHVNVRHCLGLRYQFQQEMWC